MVTSVDCTTCLESLADLLLDPAAASAGVRAHVSACMECREHLQELQATMALMDEWTAPEPSAFFDTRLHARLGELRGAEPEGLWQRLTTFLQPGRGLRPALAGALGLAMLLGGGTAATLLLHHGASVKASPTVNDLRIYDNNAQAVQQMDLLDDGSGDDAPQS